MTAAKWGGKKRVCKKYDEEQVEWMGGKVQDGCSMGWESAWRCSKDWGGV